MDAIVQVGTLVIAVFGAVLSVIVLRRQERGAARDRLLAGPIPVIGMAFYHRPQGRGARVSVQNLGRSAITMDGAGLSFRLSDGGRRHVFISGPNQIRLEPEEGAQWFEVPAPAIANISNEAAADTEIRPCAAFGTRMEYGPPLSLAIFAQVVEFALDTTQTYPIIDLYEDHVHTANLVPHLTMPEEGQAKGE